MINLEVIQDSWILMHIKLVKVPNISNDLSQFFLKMSHYFEINGQSFRNQSYKYSMREHEQNSKTSSRGQQA